jgi:hypothetical protein
MKHKTLAAKERHLNQLYADIFSQEQAVEHFIYLTNKSRGNYTTEANIRKHHTNHTLGTLLRKYDPIAFNTAD